MKYRISQTRTTLLALGAALSMLSAGCDVGKEGDRCNPDLSHDECNSGLSCQQPAYCPENYCCPTSGTSSNPFCQPGCAGGGQPPEAGADAAGEASAESGGDGASGSSADAESSTEAGASEAGGDARPSADATTE
jgi:hypothetical protein